MNALHDFVVEKAPLFINSGLRWISQDGTAHMHYNGITPPHTVVDRFGLLDLFS